MVNSKTSKPRNSHRIRTIGDLKHYMETYALSPEMLARKISLSNMTIRRMLERKPGTEISEKYWPLFDQLLASEPEATDSYLGQAPTNLFADFDSLTQDLEKAGMEEQDIERVEENVHSKMEDEPIGNGLKSSIKVLLKTLSAPKIPMSSRAIAVGALLYFLNPMDLIPDALPGVGYLDDLSVASVAISAIVKKSKATNEDRIKTIKQKK